MLLRFKVTVTLDGGPAVKGRRLRPWTKSALVRVRHGSHQSEGELSPTELPHIFPGSQRPGSLAKGQHGPCPTPNVRPLPGPKPTHCCPTTVPPVVVPHQFSREDFSRAQGLTPILLPTDFCHSPHKGQRACVGTSSGGHVSSIPSAILARYCQDLETKVHAQLV